MKNYYTYFCIILFIILSSANSFAQGEFNHWFFGNGGGLDFNSGLPVSIAGGQAITSEGSATVSDAEGNLLFYTDGMTVWNKEHEVMPNGTGLHGDFSSTQSAIIIKNPGSENLYTIFTTTNEGLENGMKYSEVDMTLDGGLGDVNENINILIETPVCEKMTAVMHSDEESFWIICQSFEVAEYHAYHFTSEGLNLNPVVSNVGQLVDNFLGTIGYLKSSPDGSKIIAAYWWTNYAELFDFDKNTGILSSPMYFDNFNPSGAYACEFSPNNNVLYISDLGDSGGSLYQFDLSLEDEAAIISSQLTIHTYLGWPGGVQLAPDQKIYIGQSQTNTLSVIHSPDSIGESCDFEENAITLLDDQTCSLGLPSAPGISIFTPSTIEEIPSFEVNFDGNQIEISSENLGGNSFDLKVYDISGKLMLNQTIRINSNGQGNIDFSKYTSGIYIVTLVNAEFQSKGAKVVVTKNW